MNNILDAVISLVLAGNTSSSLFPLFLILLSGIIFSFVTKEENKVNYRDALLWGFGFFALIFLFEILTSKIASLSGAIWSAALLSLSFSLSILISKPIVAAHGKIKDDDFIQSFSEKQKEDLAGWTISLAVVFLLWYVGNNIDLILQNTIFHIIFGILILWILSILYRDILPQDSGKKISSLFFGVILVFFLVIVIAVPLTFFFHPEKADGVKIFHSESSEDFYFRNTTENPNVVMEAHILCDNNHFNVTSDCGLPKIISSNSVTKITCQSMEMNCKKTFVVGDQNVIV